MLSRSFAPWVISAGLLIAFAFPAAAHPRLHFRQARYAGTTFCTFYRDRLGRTASNLFPRGSLVLLSRGGTAIRVRITDCGVDHFDLTPAEFRRFAPLRKGVVRRIHYRMLSRG